MNADAPTPSPSAPRPGGGALAPCPFCGGPAKETGDRDDGDCFTVTCWACEIDGPAEPTRPEANAAWNRRVPAAPADDAGPTLAAIRRLCDLLQASRIDWLDVSPTEDDATGRRSYTLEYLDGGQVEGGTIWEALLNAARKAAARPAEEGGKP